MKKSSLLCLFLFAAASLVMFSCSDDGTTVDKNGDGENVWSGSLIIVSKGASADVTLPENQDRITDNVHITRDNTKGIFNIAQEAAFQGSGTASVSPLDTEWSFGTLADKNGLVFQTWVEAIEELPLDALDKDMVLHLVTDDIYIGIKFTDWGQGAAGGGSFTYERTTKD